MPVVNTAVIFCFRSQASMTALVSRSRATTFSEPQAGKDICDRRVAVPKRHMRRFLNEGNDIRTASDMKTAIESYGGVKGCYAAVYQVQPSAQTMTKHTMTGVQASNNFSYDNRGLRMWRAYGIGPGKFYSADQLARFGTPQDPTRLVTMETFSNPNIEVGSYLQRAQMSEPGSSRQLPNLSQTEEESEKFSCQEEGCIKVFKAFAALQKHLDIGEHILRLAKESACDEIKKK